MQKKCKLLSCSGMTEPLTSLHKVLKYTKPWTTTVGGLQLARTRHRCHHLPCAPPHSSHLMPDLCRLWRVKESSLHLHEGVHDWSRETDTDTSTLCAKHQRQSQPLCLRKGRSLNGLGLEQEDDGLRMTVKGVGGWGCGRISFWSPAGWRVEERRGLEHPARGCDREHQYTVDPRP